MAKIAPTKCTVRIRFEAEITETEHPIGATGSGDDLHNVEGFTERLRAWLGSNGGILKELYDRLDEPVIQRFIAHEMIEATTEERVVKRLLSNREVLQMLLVSALDILRNDDDPRNGVNAPRKEEETRSE